MNVEAGWTIHTRRPSERKFNFAVSSTRIKVSQFLYFAARNWAAEWELCQARMPFHYKQVADYGLRREAQFETRAWQN